MQNGRFIYNDFKFPPSNLGVSSESDKCSSSNLDKDILMFNIKIASILGISVNNLYSLDEVSKVLEDILRDKVDDDKSRKSGINKKAGIGRLADAIIVAYTIKGVSVCNIAKMQLPKSSKNYEKWLKDERITDKKRFSDDKIRLAVQVRRSHVDEDISRLTALYNDYIEVFKKLGVSDEMFSTWLGGVSNGI